MTAFLSVCTCSAPGARLSRRSGGVNRCVPAPPPPPRRSPPRAVTTWRLGAAAADRQPADTSHTRMGGSRGGGSRAAGHQKSDPTIRRPAGSLADRWICGVSFVPARCDQRFSPCMEHVAIIQVLFSFALKPLDLCGVSSLVHHCQIAQQVPPRPLLSASRWPPPEFEFAAAAHHGPFLRLRGNVSYGVSASRSNDGASRRCGGGAGGCPPSLALLGHAEHRSARLQPHS